MPQRRCRIDSSLWPCVDEEHESISNFKRIQKVEGITASGTLALACSMYKDMLTMEMGNRRKKLSLLCISRYIFKARLVANGSSQQLGVDFDETFSPVVKLVTIRTVLSLVVFRQWPIHQLDVKNDFLNGDLSETVYMYQPPGFVDNRYPHHKKYALQLLERAHMVHCNPSRTPVDTESKLGPEGVHVQDPTLYRSLAGGLQYLTFTPKRQHTLSRSSAEAEYRGVVNVVAETTWLRNLLRELHYPLSTATLVYCDNVSVVYMSANLVQHQRTKHIEINIHFVRDMVTAGQVRVLHVHSRYQYAAHNHA
ncbi:ribonuclease H-like domain-containing protein [Tanacetum coccineum]